VNHTSMMLSAAMLLVLLVTAVFGLPEFAGAQGSSLDAKRPESPFACNRLALSPEQRKRHFDELGPTLRSLKKSVRELPNGYEFEFAADPSTVQLVAEWAAGERACCPFFDIDMRLEREGGSLWLGLTGREGVKRFIQADGAAWIRR
jgi:hypothetical protein